jgi:chromo domain-containing protein 1
MVDAPVDNMVQPPAGDSDSTNPGHIDVDVLFKDKWNMTFDELAALPSPARPKFASLFYLWFPDEADEQYLLLKHFLDTHRVIVLSNRLSVDDWEKFSKSSGGVVLVRSISQHLTGVGHC